MNVFFLSRQPIFDKDEKVWGYKLLYRETDDSKDPAARTVRDEDSSTMLIAASLTLCPDKEYKSATFLITMSRNFLLQGHVRGLPPERTLLNVPQSLAHDPVVAASLAALKEEGYRISITVEDGASLDIRTASRAKYLECDLQQSRHCDKARKQEIKDAGISFITTGIETRDQLEEARAQGADFFQGNYFQKPSEYSVKPMPTSMANRLKILQLLEDGENDVHELARLVEAEVRLAVRLLTFVNSANFALPQKIDSVRRAISLVGWDRMKNWMRLIAVSEMGDEKTTRELAYTSAVRAKFLELLALESGHETMAEKLYLIGLLSLLEPLMSRRMSDILDYLNLDDEVTAALLHQEGRLSPWLTMNDKLESGNWSGLDTLAAQLGASLSLISKARLEALDWANNFFRSS